MLRDATLKEGPIVIRDWSYSSDEVAGDGWILAGDAACFIDPLFSTGVHLALSAGVMSAAYVTTALRDPDLARASSPVYKRLYYSQYNLFRQLAGLFYATNRTVDSYFWEARRIIGAEEMSPRSAFIRAVAGQPPKGYERVVLERGEAPEGLVEGITAVVTDRADRRARYDLLAKPGPGGDPPVLGLVPILASDVRVERQPVLGAGEFEWGHVLVSEGRPDGLPVSDFVARLASLADGQRTVRDLILTMAAEAGGDASAIARMVLPAVGILYAEGAFDRLEAAG
jgi:hypothetical protein